MFVGRGSGGGSGEDLVNGSFCPRFVAAVEIVDVRDDLDPLVDSGLEDGGWLGAEVCNVKRKVAREFHSIVDVIPRVGVHAILHCRI